MWPLKYDHIAWLIILAFTVLSVSNRMNVIAVFPLAPQSTYTQYLFSLSKLKWSNFGRFSSIDAYGHLQFIKKLIIDACGLKIFWNILTEKCRIFKNFLKLLKQSILVKRTQWDGQNVFFISWVRFNRVAI